MHRDDADNTARVFAFLGNEDRFRILEALYDHSATAGPMSKQLSYTELKGATGVDDSGRFSYHLDKLLDRFVAKTPNGYRLLESGRNVVQTARSGQFATEISAGPSPVDATCYRCGGDVVVSYDHGHLVSRCQECAGLVDRPGLPHGTVSAIGLPAAAIDPEKVDAAFERAHIRDGDHVRRMATGICPTCCGDVHASLDVCETHHVPNGNHEAMCDQCGRWHPVFVSFQCDICGHSSLTHPLYPHASDDPVADALGDASPGWERFAALMRWPTAVRQDGSVSFEAPDGRRLVIENPSSATVERHTPGAE